VHPDLFRLALQAILGHCRRPQTFEPATRATELRRVLHAILYIARTGCQWLMLHKDVPPLTTVQGYFYDWRDNGLFENINFHLLLQACEAAGREPVSQRANDAAKKIKGRKRHIVTDTISLRVGAEVHLADIQDRDGAVLVIEVINQLFPWLPHLFADSVYNGPNQRDALAKCSNWTIDVKRAAERLALSCCHADGLSTERSLRSIETAASQRISKCR